MIEKSLLSIFSLDWEKATKNGDFLPEFVSGAVKYEWDASEKKYTDTPKCVVITAFFYALKKSKIDIVLPANSISQSTLKTWNEKVEADTDISLFFENLNIGLKTGFGGEIQIIATADSVKQN